VRQLPLELKPLTQRLREAASIWQWLGPLLREAAERIEHLEARP
jgi:hypothetical protein